MAARQRDQICGVLPLFLTGGFVTGKRLITSPFAVYGGILADSDQARSLLLERAQQLAADLEVRDLELRNAWEKQSSGLPRLSRYVAFTQQIGPDEEPILEQHSAQDARCSAKVSATRFGFAARTLGHPRV